ncbi:hypothetical protein [Paraburkholderia sp. BL10I2N1]|uniref:hypothetical protein n=1 Tax=Paraburkholderia sp. BL10I2N1 TaxID=1938796 RepID=UPI001061030B|nr:hypothetical protein [Paraburkholderia sp. BL10I2N1]TDN70482.1 hypothetical protein B0G77_3956 [Paraburkholderia sp. BL10I2N1]
MKLNEVVSTYIALRDKIAARKKAHKEELEPIEQAMEQIEAVLLRTFDATGLESAKTEKGTAYVSTRTSATVADREVFLDFIKAKEEWPLADIRAAKTAIEVFKDSNGGELPPGINWREERTINVRRS